MRKRTSPMVGIGEAEWSRGIDCHDEPSDQKHSLERDQAAELWQRVPETSGAAWTGDAVAGWSGDYRVLDEGV